MTKKYILLPETKLQKNKIVYRIQAIKNFSDVKEGDLGGFVESEKNLSHSGTCWIYSGVAMDSSRIEDDAKIYGSSLISKQALVKDLAEIRDSEVTDSAIVKNSARISFFSTISGSCLIKDYARVETTSIVTGSATVKGRAVITTTSKICDNVIIAENATISLFSTISGTALITGFCSTEYATIKDSVTLKGKVVVKDGATIYGDAVINGVMIIRESTNKSFENGVEVLEEEILEVKKLFEDEIKSSISKSNNKYGKGL